MTDQAGAPTAQPAAREGLAFRKRRPVAPAQAEDKGRVGLFEGCFLFFSVAVFLGISTIAGSDAPDNKSNPLNTALYLIVLAGCALLLWMHRRELMPVLTSSKLIWIFLAWATASIAWSLDPGLTIRRLILFYTPVLVALYAAARFDPATTIKLAGWAYFATIMVSAAVAILLPNVGVMKDDWQALLWAQLAENERLGGDWAGILGHKNVLGFATLANTQIFAWRWYVEKDKRWLFGPIVLIGMVVAYKTHSATSGLLIIMTIFGYCFLHLLRKAKKLRALMLFTVFAVGTSIIAAALMLPDQFTAMVGKSATLTGRVPLWNYLIEHVIPSRPLLGYGFNSFFVPGNPAYLRLVAVVGWPAPHAHNGYLNLAIELGIPGAVLGMLILLRLLVGAARRVDDENAPWIMYVLVFAATVTLLNLTEASLLRLSDNWEFALIFCCFALWKYQAEIRPKTDPASRRWGEFTWKDTTELK
jgi:O-antigen ligase